MLRKTKGQGRVIENIPPIYYTITGCNFQRIQPLQSYNISRPLFRTVCSTSSLVVTIVAYLYRSGRSLVRRLSARDRCRVSTRSRFHSIVESILNQTLILANDGLCSRRGIKHDRRRHLQGHRGCGQQTLVHSWEQELQQTRRIRQPRHR